MARLQKKSRRQSPQVQPTSGIPCAMVFTLIRDLPGARLVGHRRRRDHQHPSAWHQLRDARTTRLHVRAMPFVRAPSGHAATRRGHRIPRSTSVTIAKRPSCRARDQISIAAFSEKANPKCDRRQRRHPARLPPHPLAADEPAPKRIGIGGEIVKIAPCSMTIVGTLADWSQWTGVTFDSSGEIEVPGALVPVLASVEHDRAAYVEPNVWIRHPL
ncbi:hypothetical protein [Bradyrhizobium sp. SZCCHNRI1073]|uniref:hypothetical protein n=1 Tax=Bradyrhizobium TaxID=374 RepID=UPI0029161C02|nr:hypothetical protein [Bradyrhizobium sp. SZCCHNRI1073]